MNLEKKILPLLLQEFEPVTFQSRVRRSIVVITTEIFPLPCMRQTCRETQTYLRSRERGWRGGGVERDRQADRDRDRERETRVNDKSAEDTHRRGNRLGSCDWRQTPSACTADAMGTESQLFAVIWVNRQIVLGKQGPGRAGRPPSHRSPRVSRVTVCTCGATVINVPFRALISGLIP